LFPVSVIFSGLRRGRSRAVLAPTIRSRLRQVGAVVRGIVRRVVIALSEPFSGPKIFVQPARNLAAVPSRGSPG
jgi:hypothetical protein